MKSRSVGEVGGGDREKWLIFKIVNVFLLNKIFCP